MALDLGDFVDAALVAPAGVRGVEKGLDHFECGGGCDDAGAEGEDVGVVVFAGELGGEDVVGQGRADARDFVGGDGNADAGAAYDDSQIVLFRGDALAYGFAKVGIVHRVFRRSSLIVNRIARAFEIFSDYLFHSKTGVIGTDGNARLGRRFGHMQQRAGLYRSVFMSAM